MSNPQNKIQQDISNAKHGEFFFAKVLINNGQVRPSPVFVVSNDKDKEDVIICSCTTKPAKTKFDIKVQLKEETHVRTNKLYTIRRNQLLFKIPQTASPDEYKDILDKLKEAIKV